MFPGISGFRKVPEGSGRFRKVPARFRQGSGKFREGSGKVPERSGKVPEGSGRFRRVLEGSGFVDESFGSRLRKVPVGSTTFWFNVRPFCYVLLPETYFAVFLRSYTDLCLMYTCSFSFRHKCRYFVVF